MSERQPMSDMYAEKERERIAGEIEKWGTQILATLPSNEEMNHGEYLIRYWTQYVVNNCIRISKNIEC